MCILNTMSKRFFNYRQRQQRQLHIFHSSCSCRQDSKVENSRVVLISMSMGLMNWHNASCALDLTMIQLINKVFDAAMHIYAWRLLYTHIMHSERRC